jgi:mannosyltransferase OCH1-like enzyme
MLIFNKITAWHVYILSFWLICILLYQLRSTFDLSLTKLPELHQPAKQISASELLARPLSKDLTSIPRILHQCYFHPPGKPETMPPDMEKWSTGCRAQHSDWEWVLWSDADNLKLVQKYYPWLEKSYKSLPKEIFRADMARTLYMYTFGG